MIVAKVGLTADARTRPKLPFNQSHHRILDSHPLFPRARRYTRALQKLMHSSHERYASRFRLSEFVENPHLETMTRCLHLMWPSHDPKPRSTLHSVRNRHQPHWKDPASSTSPELSVTMAWPNESPETLPSHRSCIQVGCVDTPPISDHPLISLNAIRY